MKGFNVKRVILAASDTYGTLQEEIDAFKQAARTLEQFQSKFANNPVMISRMSTIVHQDSIRGQLFNHIKDFAMSEDPVLLKKGMCLLYYNSDSVLKYIKINTISETSVSWYSCMFTGDTVFPGKLYRGSVAKFMEGSDFSDMERYDSEQQMLRALGMSDSYTVDNGSRIQQGCVYVVGDKAYFVSYRHKNKINMYTCDMYDKGYTQSWLVKRAGGSTHLNAENYAYMLSNADETYTSLQAFKDAYPDLNVNYRAVHEYL